MDIAAMSINMHEIDCKSKVGVSVLKMAMDSTENEAVKMNDMISEPNKGINLDVRV